MTTNPARARGFGWLMAGVSSGAILTGAAALALAAEQRAEPVPMLLDLSMLPSSAPNVAAVAEDAPQVLDEVTEQSEPPEADTAPELETDTPPDLPVQTAMSLPQIDKPVVADLNLPPPPEEPVVEPEKKIEEPKKVEKPKEEKKEPEKKKVEKKKEPVKKAEKAEKPKEEPSTTASKAGAAGAKAGKAEGGSKVSPAAYAKSVMKKVQKKKKKVNAKGSAIVAFSVSKDGGLAGVRIARSSGNEKLDAAAVASVRSAAPFGPPPPGADTSFQIEFTGK